MVEQPGLVRKRRRKRVSQRRVWLRRLRVPLLLLAITAIVVGSYAALTAYTVYQSTQAGKTALNEGLALLDLAHPAAISADQLSAASSDFAAAQQDLASARSRLGPLGDWASNSALPGSAQQLASVGPLLDLGRDTAALATTLADGLRPVIGALHAAPSAKPGGRLAALTTALQIASPTFTQAEGQLRVAQADRHRLNGMVLVPEAARLLSTFDKRIPQLADVLHYLPNLPRMLGSEGPRRYLLVFQDPADLRATGGFIGSASLLTLDHGQLTQKNYETTTIDGGPDMELTADKAGAPPQPLSFYRGLFAFQLRDANFWPDYPTSAKAIANRYALATGLQLDGVLAITPSVISDLLAALGPLTVSGYPGTLTAANAVDLIEYYVHNRTGAATDIHRKHYIAAVQQVLLDRLQHLDPASVRPLFDQIQNAFSTRDLLLYVRDPYFAKILHGLNWDGTIRDDPGDYLAVFDQNVTDSKLNPNIDQAIQYDVRRDKDGSLECTVSIRYTNRTTSAMVNTWIPRPFYQDYLRVAVPGSVTVINRSGYSETFWPDDQERGRYLITGGVLVPASSTQTVAISYQLPASVLHGVPGYRLLVQKQPGSNPSDLTVNVQDGERRWAAHITQSRDLVFSTAWSAPSGALQVGAGL